MMPRTELTMKNQVSRLSEQASKAMSELIMAGYVDAQKADDGYAESMTYRLTDTGKKLKRGKSIAWMEKHGRFPLTEKIK